MARDLVATVRRRAVANVVANDLREQVRHPGRTTDSGDELPSDALDDVVGVDQGQRGKDEHGSVGRGADALGGRAGSGRHGPSPVAIR